MVTVEGDQEIIIPEDQALTDAIEAGITIRAIGY